MAGQKARGKAKKAVLYTGLRSFIHGSRLSAVVKGLLDAGISINVDQKTLPSGNRLKGEHIVNYAKQLTEKDKALCKARFSILLGQGLSPENYSIHFEETKKRIIEGVRL